MKTYRVLLLLGISLLVTNCESGDPQSLHPMDSQDVYENMLSEDTASDDSFGEIEETMDSWEDTLIDIEPETTEEIIEPDTTLVCEAPSVSGVIYLDNNASSNSWYNQQIEDSIDMPSQGVTVTLFGSEVQSTTTDEGGHFCFEDIGENILFMSVEVPDHYICTSTNFSTRISDAIDLGQITILTFGDSIPSFGPTPWFPENVAQFFNQFAPSSEINLAVPGTVTDNWLPGTSRFATLSEQVPQADVIIFSLGGNDLLYYVEGISAGSIPEMMEHLNL